MKIDEVIRDKHKSKEQKTTDNNLDNKTISERDSEIDNE